jgi:cytoskeletal protein CcmA (bactofilin family)
MRINFTAHTTIGEGSMFEGRCAVHGNLRVDGHFLGPALQVDQLYVGATGRVKTEIVANIVVVEGIVVGNITASSRVLLLATARVMGDLTAPELIVHDGVILDGNCSIGQVHGEHARRLIRDLYEGHPASAAGGEG